MSLGLRERAASGMSRLKTTCCLSSFCRSTSLLSLIMISPVCLLVSWTSTSTSPPPGPMLFSMASTRNGWSVLAGGGVEVTSCTWGLGPRQPVRAKSTKASREAIRTLRIEDLPRRHPGREQNHEGEHRHHREHDEAGAPHRNQRIGAVFATGQPEE